MADRLISINTDSTAGLRFPAQVRDEINVVADARIAASSVSVSAISAIGTPSSSTFLRGDGAWAVAGSGGGGEPVIAAGTTSQYWRGDKTWQTLPAHSADSTLLARANHTGTQAAATISDFSTAADARIAAATGVGVQAYSAALTAWAGKAAPSGAVVGTTDTQVLTNKTINGYTEGVTASGTVTATAALSITAGTVLTATLTASTACVFTMPPAGAGKSFVLLLKQASSTGNGTATFTAVRWGASGAPVVTAAAGKMDIFSFVCDGANWYGSVAPGFTP